MQQRPWFFLVLLTATAAGPQELAAQVPRAGWTFTATLDPTSPAQFEARSRDCTAYFERDRWTLDLRPAQGAPAASRAAVGFSFVGIGDTARIEGGVPTAARVSVLKGNDPRGWSAGVPVLDSVRYVEIYPGVDIVVRERDGHLEYDLLLSACADLDQVKVRVEGADGIHLEADGSLVIDTAAGSLAQPPPVTWEVLADGSQRPIRCCYALDDDSCYRFIAHDRDESNPLVIDPGILWSTFFGGTNDEFGWDVERAANGDFIVCGVTTSLDAFPPALGAYQRNAQGGGSDVYIARHSADGSALIWATYFGGTNAEGPFDLELTPNGDVAFAGGTRSADLPTTPGAFQTTNGAFETAFLSILDATGSVLLYSTYCGGSADEWILDIEVGADGQITTAGATTSADLPVTPGVFQTTYQGGATDAWLARFNPVGGGASDLVWCTYLGGADEDAALENPFDLVTMTELSIDVATGGATTVLGRTRSTNFPTTVGAYQTTHMGGGFSDLFVARLSSAATGLVWSTLIGGSSEETAGSLVIDALGRITLTGSSASADFPVTSGAYDPTHNGGADGIIARLDPTASALLYGSFLGGSGDDDALVALPDPSGTLTILLRTWSADFPIPPGGADSTYGGNFLEDGALCRFRADGGGANDLHYATYLGGSFNDDILDGAFDGIATLTCVGYTTSLFDYPTTPGSWSPSFNGGFFDAVLTQIELVPQGVQVLGTGSPACATGLAAGVGSQPSVGNAGFSLTGSGPASSGGLLLLSLGSLPSPVKVLGIDLWLDPVGLLPSFPVATDALGYVSIPLPLPATASLIGVSFYFQYVWPVGCAPSGVGATNAIGASIQ